MTEPIHSRLWIQRRMPSTGELDPYTFLAFTDGNETGNSIH